MRNITAITTLTTSLLISACDSGTVTGTTVTGVGSVPLLQSGQLLARAGESISTVIVADATLPSDALITVSPELPTGLSLDSQNAAISGTPESGSTNQTYTLYNNDVVLNTFSIAVGPVLPDALLSLDSEYSAEVLVESAAVPVRMARASDGRVFYIELISGNVRIIDPSEGLLPTPFATVSVNSGIELGLLGLALDPDFDSNGHVYLHATVPGENGGDDHAEIIRITDVENIGTNATVIVDDLPIAVHNGGELVFDLEGNLFIGRGDIADPLLAQTTGNLGGKVLRYTSDGGIPADNPYPGDPEWARGLRNTFAMTIHPQTGDLFGADAGAVANDKINYLEAGTNFGWGLEESETVPSSDVGLTIQTWPDAITPTALMFHTGTGQAEFEDNLFYTSYNNQSVSRLVLTGENFTDLESETEFMSFKPDGDNNQPMHIIETDDGGLYISTLSAIYHVYSTVLQ